MRNGQFGVVMALASLLAACGRSDPANDDSVGAAGAAEARADSVKAESARADSVRTASRREERDPPCLASRFGLPCASEPEP